ncbi:MAG: hypothetical protein ACRYGP_23865 [Janthinobacterium lividum]
MDTNPIKVIWLSIGRHVPDSDLVVSDFHVARNGEASGLTISVNHTNHANDDGNRTEAMAFARALCGEFAETEPMEG